MALPFRATSAPAPGYEAVRRQARIRPALLLGQPSRSRNAGGLRFPSRARFHSGHAGRLYHRGVDATPLAQRGSASPWRLVVPGGIACARRATVLALRRGRAAAVYASHLVLELTFTVCAVAALGWPLPLAALGRLLQSPPAAAASNGSSSGLLEPLARSVASLLTRMRRGSGPAKARVPPRHRRAGARAFAARRPPFAEVPEASLKWAAALRGPGRAAPRRVRDRRRFPRPRARRTRRAVSGSSRCTTCSSTCSWRVRPSSRRRGRRGPGRGTGVVLFALGVPGYRLAGPGARRGRSRPSSSREAGWRSSRAARIAVSRHPIVRRPGGDRGRAPLTLGCGRSSSSSARAPSCWPSA